MKPVTLYDVAEYAGVSYQTVSRVVNQACHVSAKTREKVEAAMAELNYIPNRVAQQLAGKQSLLIGVATSSLALHAPSQIVAAIKSRADQLGASVVVSMVERSGVEACKAAVHNLLAQRVSGLIINYPLDDQDAIAVEAACANVPALFLDVSDQTPINSIIFSHEDGTRLGVEHLVALGHQQIALLAGPLSSVSARLRLAGWHKYLTRNQIQPITEREGDWSAMSGFQQTMQMLNEGIVPTAMLVANDQMAQVAERVNWLGLGPQENYPDRLTAACFNRWDLPLSDMYTPYVFPSENGLRCGTRELNYGPHQWRGDFQFNISRYSQQQLMETSHRHLLHAEEGTWLNIDGFHMGIGGDDSWSPSVSAEFQLSAGRYHYQLVWCQK
ncbi:TPA: LacI family DNA-binding transcriptional regulator [Escherichia coli]|nr:LacI family DNA-binding transcriptional regulator [Escherichia coli]